MQPTDGKASYPIAVVQDRYAGTYSGGEWLAIGNADSVEGGDTRVSWVLSNGPYGGDIEASTFWDYPPTWIAAGPTPEAALAALGRSIDPEPAFAPQGKVDPGSSPG